MSHILDDLLSHAWQARENAYVPYSQFRVGAAVLGSDERIFTGANVENLSYGLTMCAERIAIFRAVSEGTTKIVALAFAAKKTPAFDVTLIPCGACRQVMRQFMEESATVILPDGSRTTIDRLLPMPFWSDVP